MGAKAKKCMIAQCGINCGLCKRYLAFVHQLPQGKGKDLHCIGCKERNRNCGIIKKKCVTGKIYEIDFCYECELFPCDGLKRLDEKYRKKYDYSMVENLMNIKEKGLEQVIEEQNNKYKCSKCGRTISIHDKKCYFCDKDKMTGVQ